MKSASKKLLTSAVIRNRHTKNSLGLSAHEARREKLGKRRISNPAHPEYNSHYGKLAVYGTGDLLHRHLAFYAVKKKIAHPTDIGYFKEAYILTDWGKSYLKRLRKTKKAFTALFN